jgi:hypothetical protein
MDNKIMGYISKALNFKVIFINAYAHHANVCERHIGSLQSVLIANLRSRGNEWPQFLRPSLHAWNTLNTKSLANYSPYMVHYKVQPPSLDNFNLEPIEASCKDVKEYVETVREKFAFIETQVLALKKKEKLNQEIQTGREDNIGKLYTGHLVYVLAPERSSLCT